MVINVQNVTKEIAGRVILSDVNINMTGGKIYGIQGYNGCGKTMLMKAICGLIKITGG